MLRVKRIKLILKIITSSFELYVIQDTLLNMLEMKDFLLSKIDSLKQCLSEFYTD